MEFNNISSLTKPILSGKIFSASKDSGGSGLLLNGVVICGGAGEDDELFV
jgi:hypothetical protein